MEPILPAAETIDILGSRILPNAHSSSLNRRARTACYTGQHNKPAQDGNERRRRAPRTTSYSLRLNASDASRKGQPVRWRAWRRKSPCVGVVPEGDKDLAPAKASPFIDEPSDATDSSSLTTFLETDGDRLSLKASPARSIAVRSEWPRNRKINHPLHCEMDTSRVDGVKASLHDGTPVFASISGAK